MHPLADYFLFLAKILTLVISLLLLAAGFIALIAKNKSSPSGTLKVKKLNQKYELHQDMLNQTVLSKKDYKLLLKNKKNNNNINKQKKLYVLNFNGDIRASAVENLREEITALLTMASPKDEILLRLESPGGMVHSYGLAASQLQRIKDKKIPLTISVDKVAASGGYLMACVADKIIAAPFAIIGSIGVIAQLPNFHRWLKKNNIDIEQITAGEFKRTLTIFGENTEKSREKMKESLEEVHYYFKDFIQEHRPQVDIEQAATGEHWLAVKAVDFNLVDKLQTSDDYLLSHYETTDIFEINYIHKKSFKDKFSSIIEERLGETLGLRKRLEAEYY